MTRLTLPYLETIHSSPACTLAAMQWAQYLGSTFGARGALETLRYYEDLGWISPSVRVAMVEHLEGLSLRELQQRRDSAESEESPFARHLGSLRHIAAIAGDDLDRTLDEATLQFGELGLGREPHHEPHHEPRREREYQNHGVPI